MGISYATLHKIGTLLPQFDVVVSIFGSTSSAGLMIMKVLPLFFVLCICLFLYSAAARTVESNVGADSSQVLSDANVRFNTDYRAKPHSAIKPLDAQFKSETSMSVKMRYSLMVNHVCSDMP